MTMTQFIEENGEEIRQAIKARVPNIRTLDDSDIEDWINNDEGLYNWARDCGALEEYDIEDESELQAAFWQAHPEFTEVPGQRQNDYNPTIRTAWVDFVDAMQKDGTISEDLASEVTL